MPIELSKHHDRFTITVDYLPILCTPLPLYFIHAPTEIMLASLNTLNKAGASLVPMPRRKLEPGSLYGTVACAPIALRACRRVSSSIRALGGV